MEVYGSFIHNCQNLEATEMSTVGEWTSCGTFKRYYSELKRNELSNHEKTQRAYGNSLYFLLNIVVRAFLVAQWQRIHLPMPDHLFNLWSGKTPHATEQLSQGAQQLSLCCRTQGLQLLKATPQSPYSTIGEGTAISPYTATKSSPPLTTTRENPCSNEDPAQPKIKKIIK